MLIRRIAKKSYFRFPFSSNRVYPPDSKYQQNSNTKFVTNAFFVVVVMLMVVVIIVFMLIGCGYHCVYGNGCGYDCVYGYGGGLRRRKKCMDAGSAPRLS